jgi:hypothetical protein
MTKTEIKTGIAANKGILLSNLDGLRDMIRAGVQRAMHMVGPQSRTYPAWRISAGRAYTLAFA